MNTQHSKTDVILIGGGIMSATLGTLLKELTPEKTQQIIEQLFMIFHIADLKSSDIRKAANMKTSDYEDAIQMVCAQRMKVDFIVTRNIKDFIESKVPAMKPDELLERI